MIEDKIMELAKYQASLKIEFKEETNRPPTDQY